MASFVLLPIALVAGLLGYRRRCHNQAKRAYAPYFAWISRQGTFNTLGSKTEVK